MGSGGCPRLRNERGEVVMPDDQTMAEKVRRLRFLLDEDYPPYNRERERLCDELLEYFETPDAGGEEAEPFEEEP